MPRSDDALPDYVIEYLITDNVLSLGEPEGALAALEQAFGSSHVTYARQFWLRGVEVTAEVICLDGPPRLGHLFGRHVCDCRRCGEPFDDRQAPSTTCACWRTLLTDDNVGALVVQVAQHELFTSRRTALSALQRGVRADTPMSLACAWFSGMWSWGRCTPSLFAVEHDRTHSHDSSLHTPTTHVCSHSQSHAISRVAGFQGSDQDPDAPSHNCYNFSMILGNIFTPAEVGLRLRGQEVTKPEAALRELLFERRTEMQDVTCVGKQTRMASVDEEGFERTKVRGPLMP